MADGLRQAEAPHVCRYPNSDMANRMEQVAFHEKGRKLEKMGDENVLNLRHSLKFNTLVG